MNESTEVLPLRSWIPGAVTAANIAVGFVAMLLVAEQRFDLAVYLLVLAGILDTLDGKLARWLHATSQFGKHLDSFCDVSSFGVAPAFLIYHAALRPLGAFGIAVALTYLLAGVYRLARFNLTSDAHRKSRRTLGVPIPVAAGYIMVLSLMRDRIPPFVAVAVILVAALSMVSRWRLPSLTGVNMVTGMLLVGICNYLAVVAWPNWYTVGWWNVWNLAILFAARSAERRDAVELPVRS